MKTGPIPLPPPLGNPARRPLSVPPFPGAPSQDGPSRAPAPASTAPRREDASALDDLPLPRTAPRTASGRVNLRPLAPSPQPPPAPTAGAQGSPDDFARPQDPTAALAPFINGAPRSATESIDFRLHTAPVTTLQPDYTDRDLSEALRPLLGSPSPGGFGGFDTERFEAVLRSAFRRALAEHHQGPFENPDLIQRVMWRFDALLSSRSYEEIVDEKTRRFRVEEVYLLDRQRLDMVSFASANPRRHVHPRKVETTAHRIADLVRGRKEELPLEFILEKGLRVLLRPGRHCVAAAVVRGTPDAVVKTDLDYALGRIEGRYEEELTEGRPLLEEIQPMLEECLLIHSPMSPVPASQRDHP